jgi:hypothetical protein
MFIIIILTPFKKTSVLRTSILRTHFFQTPGVRKIETLLYSQLYSYSHAKIVNSGTEIKIYVFIY